MADEDEVGEVEEGGEVVGAGESSAAAGGGGGGEWGCVGAGRLAPLRINTELSSIPTQISVHSFFSFLAMSWSMRFAISRVGCRSGTSEHARWAGNGVHTAKLHGGALT